MIELTETDFKLLKFISENEPVGIEKIKAKLSDIDSIEYRISQLKNMEYRTVASIQIPIENTSYVYEEYDYDNGKSLGIYSATDMGKKALQDYCHKQNKSKKEFWLKNAWIPILVTIATNIVIGGIKQLWPLIQQWFSSIL